MVSRLPATEALFQACNKLRGAVLQALPGQTTPDGVPAFKLVLVGDGGTGEYARLRLQ